MEVNVSSLKQEQGYVYNYCSSEDEEVMHDNSIRCSYRESAGLKVQQEYLPRGQTVRWLEVLGTYNFTIKFTPGL